jgi:hypothetical protein
MMLQQLLKLGALERRMTEYFHKYYEEFGRGRGPLQGTYFDLVVDDTSNLLVYYPPTRHIWRHNNLKCYI